MTEGERCKADAYGSAWRSVRCSRRATRDGYCGQHHPDAVAARHAKRDATWEADAREAERREVERQRGIVRAFLVWVSHKYTNGAVILTDAVADWPGLQG